MIGRVRRTSARKGVSTCLWGRGGALRLLLSLSPDLEAFAREFGFRHTLRDYREMLENPEIDLIDIITPVVLHAPMIRKAITAGKHVICRAAVRLLFEDPEAGSWGARWRKRRCTAPFWRNWRSCGNWWNLRTGCLCTRKSGSICRNFENRRAAQGARQPHFDDQRRGMPERFCMRRTPSNGGFRAGAV